MRFTFLLPLAVLWPSYMAHAQRVSPPSVERSRTLIASEARAFQRDLAARDWNTLLTHFWPAKVTARWEPPIDDPTWVSASLGSRTSLGSGDRRTQEQCESGEPTIAVVDRWARVLLPSCTTAPSELWMLEVNGRWKIVRLMLGVGRA